MGILLNKIEEVFKNQFQHLDIDGRIVFLLENGAVCRVDCIYKFNAVVMEYADNINLAKKGIFEDGDLFYIEDMSEEELIRLVLLEAKEWKQ